MYINMAMRTFTLMADAKLCNTFYQVRAVFCSQRREKLLIECLWLLTGHWLVKVGLIALQHCIQCKLAITQCWVSKTLYKKSVLYYGILQYYTWYPLRHNQQISAAAETGIQLRYCNTRSTLPSTHCGIAKWVSAYQLKRRVILHEMAMVRR